MAWYRAGGGGIPSSLKTGMNNVLNKKFGTSTTYAPATWPDNVNLLGPLPEKTVSGAIASFSDGANDVPIKSLVCNVDANLSGVSSVDVVHGVKNFVDDTLSGLEQGSISSGTGLNSNSNTRVRNADYIPFPLDKIQPNYSLTIPSGYKIAMRFYDKNKNFVTPPSGAQGFINNIPSGYVGEGVEFARFILAKTDDSNITPNDMKNVGFQIEVGSVATAYTEYVEPTTHTANLGRTIYGGSVDVVAGTGQDTHNNIVFDGSEDEQWTSSKSGDVYRYAIILPNGAYPASGRKEVWCNLGTFGSGNTQGTCFISNYNNQARFYYIPDQTIQTVEDFKTWLTSNNMIVTYEKATPEYFTFTPTPINSYYKDNNLWADTGDISDCTYRADIALALGGGS